MFHVERREFDAVLALYDRRFRDLASKVTQAQPDLYIDVQNATGRRNSNSIRFNQQTNAVELQQSIGVLPSIGLNIQF